MINSLTIHRCAWLCYGFTKVHGFAADVNLLGDSVNTIKDNSESLIEASRDIGLEINAEKTIGIQGRTRI
jgi:hypothetical protein